MKKILAMERHPPCHVIYSSNGALPILKYRITFEALQLNYNELGHCNSKWQHVLTTWAKVEISNSKSCLVLKRQHDFLEYMILIRFSSLIKTGQRILFKDKILSVQSFSCLKQKRKYLIIIARETI